MEAALETLPDDLREAMSNVAIVVEDEPPAGQPLLGLYEGIPLTARTSWYAGAAPDKISIYRGPLERLYGHDPELLERMIRRVVLHEIAHHFGISDERLRRARPLLARAPLRSPRVQLLERRLEPGRDDGQLAAALADVAPSACRRARRLSPGRRRSSPASAACRACAAASSAGRRRPGCSSRRRRPSCRSSQPPFSGALVEVQELREVEGAVLLARRDHAAAGRSRSRRRCR